MCIVFDSISSNIDEVFSINPSANVFIFGDFNVHHKDWLTYSGGTDRPGKLCYNFSNDLTQIVNLLIGSQTDSHSPVLLNLFLLTVVFFQQWLSLHWEILIMLLSKFPFTFLLSSKQDALFHCIAYDCFCADWDGVRDHLRDVPWEDIFELVSEFCEWVRAGIDIYIPHRKYQVKPRSSPLFSAIGAAAIVPRNHFFRWYQKNKE